jgi:hypothetical protein
MAPLPVIPDVFRVALTWNDTSGPTAANVMHVRAPTMTPDQIYAAMQANNSAGMWVHTHLNARIVRVDITPLGSIGSTYTYTPANDVKWRGAQDADQVIPNLASILKLSTAKRGKFYRGRLFLPFVVEAITVNGKMLETSRNTQGAAWAAWIQAMSTAGAQLGVASYTLAEFNPVATFSIQSVFGTQRRRQSRLRG